MSQRPLLFSDVFPNYDAWSQLRSVHELIDTVFTWRNSLHGEISESERDWKRSSGHWEEMAAEATTIALYNASVYRDAAAVQSAVGVLAPFIEGFLVHAFVYLGRLHGSEGAPTELTFPPEPIPARIFGSAVIQEDRTWPGSVIRLRRSSTSFVRRRWSCRRAARSLQCASCWA